MQANRKAFENTHLQSLPVLHVPANYKAGELDFEFNLVVITSLFDPQELFSSII